jgi:hypothetical protein
MGPWFALFGFYGVFRVSVMVVAGMQMAFLKDFLSNSTRLPPVT